ncbi:MAG TPA: DNA polymerase III subunit gamma/tau [Verrucomicrobiae bacterium]|nr:DNA polymerase III subunit gamma/tau [Verrucomicrobiae bacterium]
MSPTAPQASPTEPASTSASTPAARTSTAPHQALYRRWRAQTFAEIVGQTAVVETLRNAVRADRVSHAVLFVGPRGTGKTSLARILAKALNCTNLQDGDPCDTCEACVSIREGRALDLIEIDAASNRGIDAIRDLRERIQYAPTDLRRKVYILDEAHQITKDAWNALLKSLEEPPDFVAFMFASTHPQEFPPAILSRLQRFDVRRLTVEEIEGKLVRILAAESVDAEPGAVRLIARLAAGGMRDAESILDQVLASAGGRIDEASVRDLLGLADAEAIDRLTGALVDGDAGAGIGILAELDERGRDVAVVLDQILDQIRTDLGAAIGPAGQPARAAALSAAAHRLAAIDPERRGVGGLRFQIELALLDAATRAPSTARQRPAGPEAAAVTEPEAAAVTEPVPAPVAAAPVDAAPAPPAAAAAEPAAPAPAARAERAPAPTPEIDARPRRTARHEPVASTPRSAAADPAEPAATGAPNTAPATEAPPVDPSSAQGIDELRAAWPAIVAALSQSPPVKPLIAACRPVSLDGAIVTLGFPEDQAFLKDALERRRAMLEQGIGAILGRPVSVHCVATNLDHVPAIPLAEAADLISEARRIFADDLVDVGEVS